MEDEFSTGFDGSAWRGKWGPPTSRREPEEVESLVQDQVGYNVTFYYPEGKVNQEFVGRLKHSFSRLNSVLEFSDESFSEGVSSFEEDPATSLDVNVIVYIDYRFQALEDAHAEAVVAENDFHLFIEDPYTGFEHPLIASRGYFIKCGKRAVELLERGSSENGEIRRVFGEAIPGESPDDPYLFSDTLLAALKRNGSFKGVETSMDSFYKISDGLANLLFGTVGNISDVIGTILLSLIVKPFKNLLSIPSYKWDPMDPAWKAESTKATMESPHPDNWLVWYTAPKPNPSQDFFKPYLFEEHWQRDGHPAYEWLDLLSGVALEKKVMTFVRDRIREMSKAISGQFWESLDLKDILKKIIVVGGLLGKDLSFVESWVNAQISQVSKLFEKLEDTMVTAMEESWDYWYSAKNRLVVLNAFLCGVYNSVIDSILGGPELLGSLFKFIGFIEKSKQSLALGTKFATELGEDIQDALYPPHGKGSFNLDKSIEQVLTLAKEGTQALMAIGGYLAREITLVRVAYFVGALVEMILEIIVSILVTMGFGAIMTVISGLGKAGLIIEKIILAATKLNKLANLIPDQMMGIVMNWFGKIFTKILKWLRGRGDDLIRSVRKIFGDVSSGVDDLIRPEVVRQVMDEVGIDLNTLQRQGDVVFEDFNDGVLRLRRRVCS